MSATAIIFQSMLLKNSTDSALELLNARAGHFAVKVFGIRPPSIIQASFSRSPDRLS